MSGAYDPTAWSQLKTVKREWDPANLFHINDNSPVA
jgi:hypothetical protein